MTTSMGRTAGTLTGTAAPIWEAAGRQGFVAFLRAAYPGPHAAKRLAQDFGVSPETSTTWLAGQRPGPQTFDRMVERWGNAFLMAVYGAAASDRDLATDLFDRAAAQLAALDAKIRETLHACHSALHASGRVPVITGDAARRGVLAAGPVGGAHDLGAYACGGGQGEDGAGGSAGALADALNAPFDRLPCALLDHAELPLTGPHLDTRTVGLLDAHAAAGGAMTDGLERAIAAAGLASTASHYTTDGRIISLGKGVTLWSAGRRDAACGRVLPELPGPVEYLRGAHADITAGGDYPRMSRTRLRAGGVEADILRMTLPLAAAGRCIGVAMVEGLR